MDLHGSKGRAGHGPIATLVLLVGKLAGVPEGDDSQTEGGLQGGGVGGGGRAGSTGGRVASMHSMRSVASVQGAAVQGGGGGEEAEDQLAATLLPPCLNVLAALLSHAPNVQGLLHGSVSGDGGPMRSMRRPHADLMQLGQAGGTGSKGEVGVSGGEAGSEGLLKCLLPALQTAAVFAAAPPCAPPCADAVMLGVGRVLCACAAQLQPSFACLVSSTFEIRVKSMPWPATTLSG